MTYPKNDTDFRKFTISKVIEQDGGWKIHSTDGVDSQYFHFQKEFIPKKGMRYRVYAFGGLCRGLYVGGRVIRPYISPTQQREKNREHVNT